jgi:hypothetical protein
VTTAFCPNCGTPRVGAFRFCRSCQLDFDALNGTAPASGPPVPPPASPVAEAAPQVATAPPSASSVIETHPGSEGATGTPSQATGTSAGRSGIRSAGLGIGILVVFGVLAVVVLLTGGVTSGPDRADFATAANDFRATISAPSAATTLEDRKAYWAAVAKASDRFATKLRAMSFPYPTTTDVAKLTAALVMLEERATVASRLTSVGALLAVESTTTQATTNASDLEALVANDLGLASTPPAP